LKEINYFYIPQRRTLTTGSWKESDKSRLLLRRSQSTFEFKHFFNCGRLFALKEQDDELNLAYEPIFDSISRTTAVAAAGTSSGEQGVW
jgi:hypothetical protein